MPCPNGRTMRWRRRVVYRVARVRIHVPTLCYATMTYAMCRSGRVWGIGPGTVRSLVVKRGSAGTDSDTSPSRSTASQINSPSAKWPPRAPRGLPETALFPRWLYQYRGSTIAVVIAGIVHRIQHVSQAISLRSSTTSNSAAVTARSDSRLIPGAISSSRMPVTRTRRGNTHHAAPERMHTQHTRVSQAGGVRHCAAHTTVDPALARR